MIGTSINPLPLVENDGIHLIIAFNENKIQEEDGNYTYKYEIVTLEATDDYNKVLDAILQQSNILPYKARKLARLVLNITPSLEDIKIDKLELIDLYDKSSAINSFTLKEIEMWLSLEERKSMRLSLIALKTKGIQNFTYWYKLTPISMPVSTFEMIMNEVEIYALQCFNKTAEHKASIMNLSTIEEVESYDHTVGYPEKLIFSL